MPSISDYSKLIMKEGGHAFKTLSGAQFIPSKTAPFKVMAFGSGSFAAVFKIKEGEALFAIRCFLNNSDDKIERYRKITAYLKPIRKRWKVGFDLLEDEVFIDNQHLPVLKMQWIQGIPLNEYVTQILNNFDALSLLQGKLRTLNKSLETSHIGHGDLQHGNILVVTEGSSIQLKLIDYDAMYIPDLKGIGGIESGMKEYQHPKRTKEDFNERIDRFSIWVMITAIEAVKYNKSLWQSEVHGGFNTEVNFLFQGQDFLRPNESRLFRQLLSMPQPSVQYYAERLKSFCFQSVDSVDFPELYKGQVVIPQASDTDEETFSVITNPSGAQVRDAGFKHIGITPLILKKADYLSKSINLLYDGRVKNIKITTTTKLIDVSFIEGSGLGIYSGETQTPGGGVGHLYILNFSASSSSVNSGETVTISWEVKNAKSVQIERNGQLYFDNLYNKGTRKLTLTLKDEEKEIHEKFRLLAKGVDGKETESKVLIVWVLKAGIDTVRVWMLSFLILPGILIIALSIGSYNGCSSSNNSGSMDISLPTEVDSSTTQNSGSTDSSNQPMASSAPSDSSLSDSQYAQFIRAFVAAEDNEDFTLIYPYFSSNVVRYYHLNYPDQNDLRQAYFHSWSITQNPHNNINYINKTGDKQFEMNTTFEYDSPDGQHHIITSNVIFVFDNEGKISSVH